MNYPEGAVGCIAKQTTAATEITKLVAAVSAHSEQVAAQTQQKLISVMRVVPPLAQPPEKEVLPDMPPLFEQFRTLLRAIDTNLRSIEEALKRTEL